MFKLLLLAPDSLLYEGEISSLTVPGSEGYLQILKGHAPLLTSLKKGALRYIDANQANHSLDITGGILEVVGGNATVLLN